MSHVLISRCLGRLASGNDLRCHPTFEPGGYDVGFAMMGLNVHRPFRTFEEARTFAVVFLRELGEVVRLACDGSLVGWPVFLDLPAGGGGGHDVRFGATLVNVDGPFGTLEEAEDFSALLRHMVEMVAGYARRGVESPPWDPSSTEEVDVFCGRNAYATAEHHLAGFPDPLKVVGDLRRCPYGWLCRASSASCTVSYRWSAWDGRTDQVFLVVPPSGRVVQLPKAASVVEALGSAAGVHGLARVYEVDPDYDVLMDAGLDDLRAESVVGGHLVQIEVARSWRDLDPRYGAEARAIVERAYVTARAKEAERRKPAGAAAGPPGPVRDAGGGGGGPR